LSPDEMRKLGDRTVVGGFITAVGAIVAGAAHAVVFDVTGGLVTTAGAIIALNAIAFKRRGAIRAFREAFEKGRGRLEEELRERLTAEVEKVYQDLESDFEPLFAQVAAKEERIAELNDRHEDIGKNRSDELARLNDLEKTTGAERADAA
ncbi:hypothetical protein DQK91_22135, partial [Oceanidesulfovibrio marinus]